ncbi:MAG: hypothetical protein ACK40M_04350 [Flavobacteriales bacterium]
MAKKIFGLASVKLAPIANDGGMGTALETVGETVSGTATMTQEDNTTTDITIEESDSPIETIVSTVGKLLFSWSTYNVAYRILYKLFGGTGNMPLPVGAITTLGSITAGTGYTGSGFYENVALTGGAGTGARANITVSGGGVTAVEIVAPGSGYSTGNLSAAAADIGGGGSGFQVAVSAVQSTAALEKWEAPDAFPDVEMSIQLTDKKGNVVKIPRAKIASKIALSFTKEGIGQLDMEASVLQPTKPGEKRLTIQFAS